MPIAATRTSRDRHPWSRQSKRWRSRHIDRDHIAALDNYAAEDLLSGANVTRRCAPQYHDVARVFETLRTAAAPTEGNARPSLSRRSLPGSPAPRKPWIAGVEPIAARGRALRYTMTGVLATIVLAVVLAVLAAFGALPGGLQDAAATILEQVGIEVPGGTDEPSAPPESPGSDAAGDPDGGHPGREAEPPGTPDAQATPTTVPPTTVPPTTVPPRRLRTPHPRQAAGPSAVARRSRAALVAAAAAHPSTATAAAALAATAAAHPSTATAAAALAATAAAHPNQQRRRQRWRQRRRPTRSNAGGTRAATAAAHPSTATPEGTAVDRRSDQAIELTRLRRGRRESSARDRSAAPV